MPAVKTFISLLIFVTFGDSIHSYPDLVSSLHSIILYGTGQLIQQPLTGGSQRQGTITVQLSIIRGELWPKFFSGLLDRLGLAELFLLNSNEQVPKMIKLSPLPPPPPPPPQKKRAGF